MLPRQASEAAVPPAPAAAPEPDSTLGEAILNALALAGEGRRAEALGGLEPFKPLAAASDVACYYFGLIHADARERTQALFWFEAALKLNATFVDALQARACVLSELGRLDEARATLDTLVAQAPSAQSWQSRGLVCQRLGQRDEALASYDAALAGDPDHVASLASRAVLLDRDGRLEEALAGFDRLVALMPGDGLVRLNRGLVLDKLGRPAEALAAFEAALERRPDDADAMLARANALKGLGRAPEALAACDACLRQNPKMAEAHFLRGSLLHRQHRLAEAAAAYDTACRLKPGYAAALCNLGNVLHAMGQSEKALRCFANAVRHQPQFPQAWANRAHVLHVTGRFEDAVAAASEALRQKPGQAPALTTLGLALQALGHPRGAQAAFAQALHVAPAYPEAWLNQGVVQQQQGLFDKALASYREAARLRPDYPEAFSNLGVLMRELGRMDESLACFNRALALRPGYADACNNRGGTLLLNGRFPAGWDDLEGRWEKLNAPQKFVALPCPAWTGQDLAGRRIAVLDEQGLGDLIQFARYLPLLAALGAEATLFCRGTMHRLLQTLPAPIALADRLEPGATFDYQISLMSLPRVFGTTLASIPAARLYLAADPAAVATWREKLPPQGRVRIGLCWRGNPMVGADRSIPIEAFAPLAALPNVDLVSLMKGGGGLPPDSPIRPLGAEFDMGADAFHDAAAVLANLDLVITCDTSMAHLAGALGRPVWVALKRVPDWRWLLDRADSPWYPSMRLFRQTARGDWSGVVAEMTSALHALV